MNTAKQARYAATLSSACNAPGAVPSASTPVQPSRSLGAPILSLAAIAILAALLSSCGSGHRDGDLTFLLLLQNGKTFNSVEFGNVPVNQTATQQITVDFVSFGSTLTESITGDEFGQDNDCPQMSANGGMASSTCTITVNVTPTTAGSISGTLEVALDSAHTFHVPLNATGVASAGPVLGVTKVADSSTYTANGSVGFTITVKNTGNGPTTGTVTVTDVLDPSLAAFPIAANNWNCTLTGNTVSCSRNDALASGASYDVIIVQAEVNATPPASITNVANATGGGAPNTSGSVTVTLTQ